jgi:cytochrome c oxidase subunit 1
MYSTLLVAVPTGVKFFSWVGTIWGGKIGNPSPTPFLFVLGGIIVFLMGGLTGPPNATVSTDLHLHDTYWVVGHFHDTMFGGYIFPFFAAIYYWYPKATGRRMSERLGQWHFWLMTPAFLLLTFTMMYSGLQGMRRRIADFDPSITSSGPWNILGTTFQGLEVQHLVMTLSAFVIAISILIFFINFFRSQTKGEVAEGNVWRSRSPEWQVPSPMPVHNYDKEFEVVNEPYDYGLADHPYIRFIEE